LHLLLNGGLEVLQRLRAGILVHARHDVAREVEHLLQVARRQIKQQADTARRALEVPDVADRRRQLDMAHALAPDLRASTLHAAFVADNALEAHALVLAAVALPVLCRTEDALAEQAILLRLERTVVDGLRLRHLAIAPGANLLGAG